MTVLSDPTPAEDLPPELTIPLPRSASCSEKDYEEEPFSFEAIRSLPQSHDMEGLTLEDGLPKEETSGFSAREPSVADPQMASLDDLALLGAL